jgi:branched-chain amino acid transport system ATP-binding protein
LQKNGDMIDQGTEQLLLSVQGLHKEFGGVIALSDLDCEVRKGQIKAIIGPNGAGKTTFFNVVTGVLPPTNGSIHFEGQNVCRLPTHRIAKLGIGRTFQSLRLFRNMTVLENVMVGCHMIGKVGIVRALLRLPGLRLEERELRERSMEILRSVNLDRRGSRPVHSLTFYEQRRLEIARALVASPRLLLLDEPAAGLNIRETEDMGELIRKIRSRGMTVILVEHDMSLVMEISDEVLVLDHGEKIAEGVPEQIQHDQRVIAVYLGEESHE